MNMRNLARALSDTATSIQRRHPESKVADVVSITLAHALAYTVSIPTSPVTDPNSYFIERFLSGLEEKVATVNEYYIVDIDAVLMLTRELWVGRYNVVYNPTSPEAYAHSLSYLHSLDTRVAPRFAKLAGYAAVSEVATDYQVMALVVELCEGLDESVQESA